MNKREEMGHGGAFRGFLVLLGILAIGWFAAYGLFCTFNQLYDGYFKKKEIPVSITTTMEDLGPQGNGVFSDMNEVLRGLERQLVRMNDIQERIHGNTQEARD